MIAGLVFLGIAVVLAIATITDFLYDSWIVYAAPAAIFALLATFWFLRPLLRSGILRPINPT